MLSGFRSRLHHPQLVDLVNPQSRLGDHVTRRPVGQFAGQGNQFLQRDPFERLQGDVVRLPEDLFGGAGVIRLDQIWMVELLSGLGFQAKTGSQSGILAKAIRQNFQGDLATGLALDRSVDGPHPAPAQRFLYQIPSNPQPPVIAPLQLFRLKRGQKFAIDQGFGERFGEALGPARRRISAKRSSDSSSLRRRDSTNGDSSSVGIPNRSGEWAARVIGTAVPVSNLYYRVQNMQGAERFEKHREIHRQHSYSQNSQHTSQPPAL